MLHRLEDGIAALVLTGAVLIPSVEIVARGVFGVGLPGAHGYVQHFIIWLGFLGAAIAAREHRHLSLVAGRQATGVPASGWRQNCSGLFAAAVSAGLCWSALQFVLSEIASTERVAGWLPIWIALLPLPLTLAVVVFRQLRATAYPWLFTLILLAALVGVSAGALSDVSALYLLLPGLSLIAMGMLLGAPLFTVLGGCALLLFAAEGVPLAAVMVESYRIATSPLIPAIPLFTLTGYLLAQSRAGDRLVRVFRAFFGWLPGGLAIVTALACAFFTTFTGGSGVTVVALGGLLLPLLSRAGYSQRFATGLVTASGSIGLLFPPSLAVILYGVVAHVPVPELFLAGIVPGLLMVAAVALVGIVAALRSGLEPIRFDSREALAALVAAKWELLLPLIVIGGVYGGYTTLLEAAALTVLYTFVVEAMLHRDLDPITDAMRALSETVVLFGAIFLVLCVAMGLTNYLVDAEVPLRVAAWMREHVESRLLFLLLLNVFLLAVGCLMDIFAAIVVVVPLLFPLGQIYGLDPLHLAMIFLVNLELGYLTPPVGMNLLLASMRFQMPLAAVCRSVAPFVLILIGVVLLVTYVPGILLGIQP